MSISNYAETKILDHALRNTSWTSPAAHYMSLHSADPAETGANEATGGSYVRQSIAFDASYLNSGAITFTLMPAGTWTHFAIWDASSGGNCIWEGSLTASKTTGSGDTVSFAAGAVAMMGR